MLPGAGLERLWHHSRAHRFFAAARWSTDQVGLALAKLIAARHPDRTVHVVGDAAYVGEHPRGLATKITWTSRLTVTSVLHELAPPHNGTMGRPRTTGARLGTPPIWRLPRPGAPPTSGATDAPTPCTSRR